MNAKHLIAAVAVLAATGSALAQQYVAPETQSTRTRAEVIAELPQARADGSLDVVKGRQPVLQASGTAKSREEVRAELAQHRLAHPHGVLDGIYFGD